MDKRKGARRMSEIPPDVLAALNVGQIETANLIEYLAVDLVTLLTAIADDLGIEATHPRLQTVKTELPNCKPMQRHWAIARALADILGNDASAHAALSSHRSDLARQWAAQIIGLRPAVNLSDRLGAIRPFAADTHFAVREMAWLAVRDAVIAELPRALALLQPWVFEADANLRRFASELTRPRGVWCAHIELLKSDPRPGLALLEPLKADPSRYVQDSVANWLNDAGKNHPDWVMDLCARWSRDSDSKPTQYICRRATRFRKSQS